MAKTPTELALAIEKSIPEIEKAVHGYSVLVVNEVEGAMKSRIFNKGGDWQGGKIGKYKEGRYKKKREKAGRQTEYVDAQFTGELNRSIQKGIKDGKEVIGFIDQGSAQIAGFLEGPDHYNKPIFTPSETELNEAIKTGEKYMLGQLQKIVESWS